MCTIVALVPHNPVIFGNISAEKIENELLFEIIKLMTCMYHNLNNLVHLLLSCHPLAQRDIYLG